MTGANPTNPDAARALERFELLDSVLEVLLEEPDPEGMNAAARELGIFHDGQIVLGEDDEAGALLDYYLFAADAGDGRTRIQSYVESPPAAFSEPQRELLEALGETRFSVFVCRGLEPEVALRDLVRQDDSVSFASKHLSPFTAVDEIAALRVFKVGDQWLNTGTALPIPSKLRMFYDRPGPIHELASIIDKTKPDESKPIDDRILLRAIIGGRLAQHMADQDGMTLKANRKRSLGRPDRKRKGKRKR